MPNIDYNKLIIRTGLYAQVHINASITNTPKARTVVGIALYQADENGSWYFMSLETGERLHSNNWIELPISDDIIRRVNEMGLHEGQADMRRGGPIFEWGPNERMEDEEPDDEQFWHHDDDDDNHGNENENEIDATDEQTNQDIIQDNVHMEDNTEIPTEDVHEQSNDTEPEEHEEYAPTGNQERDPMEETTIEGETSDDDKSIESKSAQEDHDEHDDHADETGDTNDDNDDHDAPSEAVNVGGHNL